MAYQSMGDKCKSGKGRMSENNEGRVEKRAERKLKNDKMKNEYKPHKGLK